MPNIVLPIVCRRISEVRKIKCLSYNDLSELSGISAMHLWRIENGWITRPQKNTLAAIADALGTTVADLNAGMRIGSLAPNLKRIRSEAKLTFKQLAEKSELSQDEIIAIEEGEIFDPPISTCLKLAQAFQVPINELIRFKKTDDLDDPQTELCKKWYNGGEKK